MHYASEEEYNDAMANEAMAEAEYEQLEAEALAQQESLRIEEGIQLDHQHEEEMRKDMEWFAQMDAAPIQLRKVIQCTKSYAETFAAAMIEEVKEGGVDAVETGVKIKFLQEVLKQVYEGISDTIRTETEKGGREGIESSGARVELTEVGTKYDYSGDPVWARNVARIEPLLQQQKERETFLKTVKKSMEIIDDETGEVITVPPPVKTSTSSIKISLGK